MSLTRMPVSMLAQNNFFASKAAAQAANLGQLNARHIMVVENGEIVLYHPVAGAVDLVGADGSTWERGSVGTPDLIALAGDLSALFTGITVASGSITPELFWSGGGGSFTYTLQTGRWAQLGAHMQIDLAVSATLASLGIGNLQIGGLAAGLRPVTGLFPGYLDITAKSDTFLYPYGTADFRISWTGGSERGVFSYFSASGEVSVFVSGLTGATIPSGNNAPVEWSGGSGRIIDWQPSPSDGTQGRMRITNINGVDPTGAILLTGGGWSATAAGLWAGARPGERFLNAGNFSPSRQISFSASGRWLVG